MDTFLDLIKQTCWKSLWMIFNSVNLNRTHIIQLGLCVYMDLKWFGLSVSMLRFQPGGLTETRAPVAVHPGGVRGAVAGVTGGRLPCLGVMLRQIQDAPHGKTELCSNSHSVRGKKKQNPCA